MPTHYTIVTLDGPAGVGKTTLAKRVAQALGIAYLDTGAMFRVLGWKLGHLAGSMDDAELRATLAAYSFTLTGSGADTTLCINGIPVGNQIRTEEVGMLASKVAQIPVVRSVLKELQQGMGQNTSLVTEGRDMGSVVFPDAPYKFFLDASPEERARRRYDQLTAMGETPDLPLLTSQIKERDAQDRNRSIAPLRPAENARIIDTTSLDIDGVFNAIMQHIPKS